MLDADLVQLPRRDVASDSGDAEHGPGCGRGSPPTPYFAFGTCASAVTSVDCGPVVDESTAPETPARGSCPRATRSCPAGTPAPGAICDAVRRGRRARPPAWPAPCPAAQVPGACAPINTAPSIDAASIANATCVLRMYVLRTVCRIKLRRSVP